MRSSRWILIQFSQQSNLQIESTVYQKFVLLAALDNPNFSSAPWITFASV